MNYARLAATVLGIPEEQVTAEMRHDLEYGLALMIQAPRKYDDKHYIEAAREILAGHKKALEVENERKRKESRRLAKRRNGQHNRSGTGS